MARNVTAAIAALVVAGCGAAPTGGRSTGAPSTGTSAAPTSAASAVTPGATLVDYCPSGPTIVRPAESTAVASGSVLGEISIGTDAYDVAVADGSIWVVSALDGYVKRIDPANDEVVATIDLGAKSEDSYLLAQGSRLWFTRWGQSSAPSVGWIDMTTNRVGEVYAVAPVPLGLTLERDSLWVTAFDSQTVAELDSRTGEVRRSIVVDPDRSVPPEAGPTDLVALDGSLWIVGHRARTLIRVDTATGMVTERLCLPLEDPERIELAFGALWISDPGRAIVRVDPRTSTVVATIGLPNYDVRTVRQPWGMAAGEDRLWVAAGTVAYWIDPVTNTVPGFVQLTDEQAARDHADVYPGAGIQNLAVDGDELFAGFPGLGTLIRARS